MELNIDRSLSARRAWIEITSRPRVSKKRMVALRKESVDRNLRDRRHWQMGHVALRKESVDRNVKSAGQIRGDTGRSPQGERG